MVALTGENQELCESTCQETKERWQVTLSQLDILTRILFSFQEGKWKKCTLLGNSFPEVNISEELNKDKVQALKDYQENGVFIVIIIIFIIILLRTILQQNKVTYITNTTCKLQRYYSHRRS